MSFVIDMLQTSGPVFSNAENIFSLIDTKTTVTRLGLSAASWNGSYTWTPISVRWASPSSRIRYCPREIESSQCAFGPKDEADVAVEAKTEYWTKTCRYEAVRRWKLRPQHHCLLS
jgi:hypothetical protein